MSNPFSSDDDSRSYSYRSGNESPPYPYWSGNESPAYSYRSGNGFPAYSYRSSNGSPSYSYRSGNESPSRSGNESSAYSYRPDDEDNESSTYSYRPDDEDNKASTEMNSYLYASTCTSKEIEDYEKLLITGNFSDITIKVGEKVFKVHKAIITSRSPVFEAMLKHDMKEKGENIIKLKDITPEVMEEVLRFIYAAKVNNIDNIANDLLLAAEKYSIPGLKELCIKTLLANLEIENALELLIMADMCNAAYLKSAVIDFIARKQEKIVPEPQFDQFKDLYSNTQLELVRAMVARNQTMYRY